MDAITQQEKEKIVLCNIIPAAIYGAESSPINKAAMKSLRSAIAFAIGPSSGKRNVDLVFNSTNTSKDLDPMAHILYQRIAALRRTMSKHEGKQISYTK